MRTLSLVTLAVLCAALSASVSSVHAFPSRFLEITTYNSVGCNGTASAGATTVFALDECYSLTATTSASYSISAPGTSSSGLVYTTFSGTVCAGTGTSVPFSGTVSGNGVTCLNSAFSSTLYTVPSTRANQIWGVTTYSDSSCTSLSTALFPNPQYKLANVCSGTTLYALNDGQLQVCLYNESPCSGGDDCTNLNNGECVRAQGTGIGGRKYEYNGAATGAVPVSGALAVALAAVVALATRNM